MESCNTEVLYTMKIASLIIGIDGWQKYTQPLIDSLAEHEPECLVVVIDNASQTPYPAHDASPIIQRTERLCYSAAINRAHDLAGDADWYIVLSNDVLCTGPFSDMLVELPSDGIAGPQIWHEHSLDWIVGWCVCIPQNIWNMIGGWDENYKVSSWEDVDLSATAVEHDYDLYHVPALPFVHLDQKQRFTLTPNYWSSETFNRNYFFSKHAGAK